MRRVLSINLFPAFILFFFLILTFYRLPWTFFQQDEWLAFGKMAVFEQDFSEGLKLFLPKTFFQHFNLATFLIEFFQFKFFRMNFSLFALVSLSFHFLNSLLIYYFILEISQKKTLSLIASLLFLTNSLAHQATTWMSAGTSAQGATLFLLISLIYFFKYLKNGQEKIKLLFFSLISFFVSLMFKESSIFLFVFFPILWLITVPEKSFSKFRKIALPILLTFVFYMLIRGLFLFYNLDTGSQSIAQSKTVQPSIITYIYRFADLPFKALPQSFFTTEFLVNLSRNLVMTAYPHWLVNSGSPNPFVVESIAFDYINFILSILIFIFTLFIYKLLKEYKDKKNIKLLVFSIIFIIVSYSPFIFIQDVGGFISIAEPRNLYIPGIGSSTFLALSITTISRFFSQKIQYIEKDNSLIIFILVLLFPLLFFHTRIIRRDIKALDERSKIRVNILKKISAPYRVLPEKIIFYTESDTSYYGLPLGNNILPFQSGFGQILLVWYYSSGQKIPKCFFENEWLYELDKDQDYKYCSNRGFGYFRKLDTLSKALKENNLSAENIVAFSWNSNNKEFREITSTIRKRLKE